MTANFLRPFSLLLLRIGTGLLLVLWGGLRLTSPTAGPGLAKKYYGGLMDGQLLQTAFGALEVALGLLVVAGLLRRYVYPLQALILTAGALAIWRYLVDPLGLYLLDADSSQILFFPSIAVAGSSLVLLAFVKEDRFALDNWFGRENGTDLSINQGETR